MMQELIVMAAAAVSYETILEHLREDIHKFLITKSEEDFNKIQFECAVFMAKEIVEEKGPAEMIKDMEDFSNMSKLLKPNKN